MSAEVIPFNNRDRELYAVASLVGECEAMVASGTLPEIVEMGLRVLIADTLAAFRLPAKADLPPHPDKDASYARLLCLLAQEMANVS